MNRNTSIVLVAAVAGILVAGALAVTMTNQRLLTTTAKNQVIVMQEQATEELVELAELAV